MTLAAMTWLDWIVLTTVLVMAFAVFGWLCGLWMGWWRSSNPLDRKLGENRQRARHRAAQRRESSMKGRRWPRL